MWQRWLSGHLGHLYSLADGLYLLSRHIRTTVSLPVFESLLWRQQMAASMSALVYNANLKS